MSILVSINCITYNHEKYIRSAIEGFIMQKTNFEYEIVIGEDCSTDKTREIIEEYVRIYPEKIVLVTSEKNVGASNNQRRIHNKSRGKYIALCEGDDYWIDPYKLQKQVDYMEANPQCTFCFHNAKKLNAKNNTDEGAMIDYNIEGGKYTAGEVALMGFIPTASFLYKKSSLDNPPQFLMDGIVGDLPIKLVASSHGYAYYLDEIMSVYRVEVEGSAMSRWNKKNVSREKIIKHNEGYLNILNGFNKYSNNKYFKEIDKVKLPYEYIILVNRGDIKQIKSSRYKERYNESSLFGKIRPYIIKISPRLYDLIYKIIRIFYKKI